METTTTKTVVVYDDFQKLDIRTGTITKAEIVPKSKKLLKLEVFFGEAGSRTILAGIAHDFDPDNLPGTIVTAVLNLAPREMMGIMSHGMLLAGKNAEGKLSLVTCAGMPDGTEIG